MRPGRGAPGGEGHRLAYLAQPREPPTMMDPAPASDEAISDPGRQTMWGKPVGKNNKIASISASRMLAA